LGSLEICSSCGYQFGYDDDSEEISHEEWRQKWIKNGMKWWSRGVEQPKEWDAKKQLQNISIFLK